MRYKAVLIFPLMAIFLAVLYGCSLATSVRCGFAQLELVKPLIGPDSQLPRATSPVPYIAPAEPQTAHLGEAFLLGTTWYDYQHNCTISKMVALTENRGVHFCWMNGYQAMATDRHIFYNYWNPHLGDLAWPGVGFGPVDQGDRGGYTNLSQFSAGQAVIALHQNVLPTDPWTASVAFDFMEGSGAFQIGVLPPPPGYDALAWPHSTVDAQDNIHLVAHENTATVWQRINYARSEDGGYSYTDWTVVDTIAGISGDMAASPVSNKVGLTYTKSAFNLLNLGPYEGYLVSQMNNDIVLIESEDGTTWDFSNRQNLTNLIEPDSSRYPDTTYA
ncbi:MAG: hypothetical protein AMJ92_09455, partial [candidate division Zixibacteria bacterium SM23_81]